MAKLPNSYSEALALSMSLVDFERGSRIPDHHTFHLDRMNLLLHALGEPQNEIPSVHIAGTKGKGSTSAMVTSVLTASGYKPGLITSPHLHSVTERIRHGLEPITKPEFVSLVRALWPAVETVSQSGGFGGVTWFEFMIAASFYDFVSNDLDFMVVETGLGGRLDATNVIHPEVSAITSISLDHTKILGDTVEKIAAEKGGIIKQGVPVVVSYQQEKVHDVLRSIARKNSSEYVNVSKRYSVKSTDTELTGQTIEVCSNNYVRNFKLPLIGSHQVENTAIAVGVVDALKNRGYEIGEQSIVKGMEEVKWRARFDVLQAASPAIVVDGAHNPYSMDRLTETCNSYTSFDRVIVVYGSLSTHEMEDMLLALKKLRCEIIGVESRHPKASSATEIKIQCDELNLHYVKGFGEVSDGFAHALSMAKPNDLILGTGSLSVAAEIIEAYEGIVPEIYEDLI